MSVILNKLKKEAVIYCPLCNQEYAPINLRIVEQAGETILAHSHCPRCTGAILSLLYSDFIGITLVGLVTDLNYEDALKLKNTQYLEADEVLALHQAMNN